MLGFDKRKASTAKTLLSDAGLNEKDVFHYWFDFGDDWWHRIHVQRIDEVDGRQKFVRVVKSVGESPPQYPDDDDYDGYE